MNIRCQQKCDKGSQCTRAAEHTDGYHLTEHGCVCLTEDKRAEINQWFKVQAEVVPPAHPGTVPQVLESRQEISEGKVEQDWTVSEYSTMVGYALAAWERR